MKILFKLLKQVFFIMELSQVTCRSSDVFGSWKESYPFSIQVLLLSSSFHLVYHIILFVIAKRSGRLDYLVTWGLFLMFNLLV